MNKDISYIHSNKLAIPDKLYYGKDGVYIGLSNGRLKKLDKNSFSYFQNKQPINNFLLRDVTFETDIDLGEIPVNEITLNVIANVTEKNKVFVQEIFNEDGDSLTFKTKCYQGYFKMTVNCNSFVKGIKKIQYIVI